MPVQYIRGLRYVLGLTNNRKIMYLFIRPENKSVLTVSDVQGCPML